MRCSHPCHNLHFHLTLHFSFLVQCHIRMDFKMRTNFCFSSSVLLSALLFLGSIQAQAAKENVEALPKFDDVEGRATVSGFSSGCLMAIQMQVAFSRNIAGSACFEGIWYRCAPGGSVDYRAVCNTGLRNVNSGITDAKRFASEGKIDPVENMKNQTHYHYIAKQDVLVYSMPQVRAATKTFFRNFDMPEENITLVFRNADHWMPTANTSYRLCRSSLLLDVILQNKNTSGIANCDYYGAFEGLQHIYNGALTRPSGSVDLQPLRAFNQSAFLDQSNEHFMDKVGYFYVPSKCQGTSSPPCRFHIAMHGCRGSRSAVGTDFVTGSGYLEVAEVNSIRMLFPQSIPFSGNDDGCWDIFGASNSETYAIKNGVQMEALGKMTEISTGLSLF